MARLKKAREEAEFKKRMTERSSFSATSGVKKARKVVKNQSKKKIEDVSNGFRVVPAEIKKFGNKSHIGGVDSSQIVEPRNRDIEIAERPPLYIPKNHTTPLKQ